MENKIQETAKQWLDAFKTGRSASIIDDDFDGHYLSYDEMIEIAQQKQPGAEIAKDAPVTYGASEETVEEQPNPLDVYKEFKRMLNDERASLPKPEE